MRLRWLVDLTNIQWDYSRQFLVYYVVAFSTLAHFVYTELFWVPRLDKLVDLTNPAISRSYQENETITGSMCMILAVLVPLTVCLAHCLSADIAWQKSNPTNRFFSRDISMSTGAHYFHCAMVLLWTSIGITAMCTNVLKFWISNFRPDFLERCQPSPSALESISATVLEACEQSDVRLLHEGLKSTPSGHSSMITSGTAFATLWVRSHVAKPRDWRSSCWWCPILALIVMVSRAVDHRHHWYDIVAGATLALTVVTWLISRPLPFSGISKERVLPT